MASQICQYALTAVAQELSACGQALNQTLMFQCACTTLDAASVKAFCVNDPPEEWQPTYNQTLQTRDKACKSVNLTAPTLPLLPVPSNLIASITGGIPTTSSAAAQTVTSAAAGSSAAAGTAPSASTATSAGLSVASAPLPTVPVSVKATSGQMASHGDFTVSLIISAVLYAIII